MKASELRIGLTVDYNGLPMNIWAIWNNSSPKQESYCVDLDSQEHDRHLKGIEIEELKPIPLTEEWLVRFGFEQNNQFKNYFTLWLSDNDIPCFSLNFHTDYSEVKLEAFNVKIQYVHQLQNLYHALTGEDLTHERLLENY